MPASSDFKPPSSPIVPIVQGLLSFPPVFNLAANAARNKIKDRAAAIGVNFDEAVARIQVATDWEAALAAVTNPNVSTYPAYYTKPFHGTIHEQLCTPTSLTWNAAYPEGNLNWNAAFEVDAAAVSVHSNVMDPAGKILQPE